MRGLYTVMYDDSYDKAPSASNCDGSPTTCCHTPRGMFLPNLICKRSSPVDVPPASIPVPRIAFESEYLQSQCLKH